MAQPNTQAGLGHPPGAAGQPQVAQRQAQVGEKTVMQPQQLQRPVQGAATNVGPAGHPQQQTVAAHSQPASRAVPQAAPPPADDRESSDWGLEPARSGISRENKFILFVLLVLVAVFSFVVFRNFQKKQNGAKSEVASKDAKPEAKKGKGAKKESKSDAEAAPPLQEPHGAEAHAETELVAETNTKELADDPFGTGSAPNAAAPAETEAAPDIGQTLGENAPQEAEAPPQLNSGVAEEMPQEATQQFEPPVQAAETAQAAEIPEATPTARRGKALSQEQQEFVGEVPNRVNEPLRADPMEAEPMQQPAEIADFTETATPEENTFAQTAGTAAEPIRRKGTTPRASGIETAQAPVPTDALNGPPDTFTPTTAPRTTAPRTTTPRATTPRNAPPAVPAPPVTQPRGNVPPPPLDPNDERLGGYREGQLQGAPAHRTTARPPAATGQFNPQSEPLIANIGEYIVRPNDNYWRISRKVYGTPRYFAALAKHNEPAIPNPRHMKPGIKILTPAKEQLEQQYPNLLPVMATPQPVGAVMRSPNAPKTPGFYIEADGQPAYRIGPSETLWTISKKTLGRSTRWEEIYDLNKDRLTGSEALAVGSILRLPPDAGQSQVVGKPVEHR